VANVGGRFGHCSFLELNVTRLKLRALSARPYRVAALAGGIPDYLYGGTARAGLQKLQIPLGPLSIGQASAIEMVLGAPPPPGAWEEGGGQPANKTGRESWIALSTS